MRAFVLGAGLGTRLKTLTDVLPKPMIPVWHRPLITFAFEHLRTLGVDAFVVNTHHLPGAFRQEFPDNSFRGCPITFRHEPVLLETGGGLANVADLLQDEPFVVYNGDVLTDLPLQAAVERHRAEGNLVTLALRSQGAVCNVAFDAGSGRVLDIRNRFGLNHPRQFQFTGLYVVDPAFFRWLIPGKIESVVEAFLRAMAAGERIGAVVADEGDWWDLGDRTSYLAAHGEVKRGPFPRYAAWNESWKTNIHPEAEVASDAQWDELSCVGPHAKIGAGARLCRTLVWSAGKVAPGAVLEQCIVRGAAGEPPAQGSLHTADI
jgi:mannose-1-phosphate guanylyltransferase/mannose-1-phosphate guanylyltransferase/phosphomannomutase